MYPLEEKKEKNVATTVFKKKQQNIVNVLKLRIVIF